MSIIKSFSVGNGDMFYIKHNSDNFTIIDCCINDENEDAIISELKNESRTKGITRFISTHPDEDHLRGLEILDMHMPINNFYCVKNKAIKLNMQETFKPTFNKYTNLRDSDKAFYIYNGCKRKWMNISNEERDCSGINILWPDLDNQFFKDALTKAENGESPNNISPIIEYSLEDGATVLWMGDLETDFLNNIKPSLSHIKNIDILFAPHHGRDSGKVPTWLLQQMNPKVIIIGEAKSEHLNYYQGYNTIKQNSAGDIMFDCVDKNVHIFVSNSGYDEDFLINQNIRNRHDGFYIGTLKL